MSNEVRIKPLLKYEVELANLTLSKIDSEVFTADSYDVRDGRTIFYRTGNPIKEYQCRLKSITATPVDDAELSQ